MLRYPEALEKLKIVLEVDPQNLEAFLMRGRIAETMGHDVKAAQAYNDAVLLRPESRKVRYRRMIYHASKNRWTLAARDLCALIGMDNFCKEDYPLESLIHILVKGIDECILINRDFEGVRDFANSILKIDPGNDLALGNRGLYHLMNQNHDAALGDFSDAIKRDRRNFRHFFYRGQLYELMGDLAKAESDYAYAEGLNPVASDVSERLRVLREKVSEKK